MKTKMLNYLQKFHFTSWFYETVQWCNEMIRSQLISLSL